MHLVQMLLPVVDNNGRRLPSSHFEAVRREMTDRFGGVTAYTRAPAVGLWQPDTGDVQRDDVVMVEVVVEQLDRAWWAAYRQQLEAAFEQETILVRAIAIEQL
jgi:hypothetical protein